MHKNQQELTKFVKGTSINAQMRKGCNKKISTPSETDYYAQFCSHIIKRTVNYCNQDDDIFFLITNHVYLNNSKN